MSHTASTRVMSPEEIAAQQMQEAPQFRLAALGDVFRERELRLRQLAAGHAMRDYLLFMADVCAAQHRILQIDRPELVLPTQEALAEAARQGVAPLSPERHARHACWHEDLSALLTELAPKAAAGAAPVIAALQAASSTDLDRQADRLLHGVMLGLDLGQAPLIGAALQVYWTRLVARTQHAFPDLAFGRVDEAKLCPCCASLPVASMLRIGGAQAGSRYLHCGLCQTQWHMLRIQCAHCGSGRSMAYHELEPGDAPVATAQPPQGAVRTETCDDCHHYLKIMAMDKDAYVDPVADDLASVSLDLLTAEAGFDRHGVNVLLLFGSAEESASEAL